MGRPPKEVSPKEVLDILVRSEYYVVMNRLYGKHEAGIGLANRNLNLFRFLTSEDREMALPSNKMTVSVILDVVMVDALDKVANEVGISRSQLISNCVDVGLDQLCVFKMFGLSPRRMKKLSDSIEDLGLGWLFDKSGEKEEKGKRVAHASA